MATFTVHRRGSGPEAIRNAVLVPTSFSRAAFVFGPLWLLSRRLWLAALLWIAVAVALGAASALLTGAASFALWLVLALVTGLEAQTWRRHALARRGFELCDLVSAPDLETAEYRVFSQEGDLAPATTPTAGRAAAPASTRPLPVLGLFPEAEGGR